MNEIIILPSFEKGAKRLIRKYKSLAIEISAFIALTEKDGVQGISIGNGIFKARLAVKSKNKGKSGGLRVISYSELFLSVQNNIIYLVAIYDKNEVSSINKSEINRMLEEYK
jgi:hypothetical protein